MLREQELHKKRLEILEEQLQNEKKKMNTNGFNIFFFDFTNTNFFSAVRSRPQCLVVQENTVR